MISEELVTARQFQYPISSNSDANGKLSAREVYNKILDGAFYISPPEKTKTSRSVVSKCWTRGMKLVVENVEPHGYMFTG